MIYLSQKIIALRMRPEKYLRYLVPASLFGTARTKEILTVNPNTQLIRADAKSVHITVYDYNSKELHEHVLKSVDESLKYKENDHVTWINIDGLRKADV